MSNDTNTQNFSLKNDSELEQIRHNVRFQAVKILNRYERSSSYIDKLLKNSFNQYDFSKQDRSLLTEIVYGCVRWKSKLDWVLTGFFHGDFNKCTNPIKNAMRVGLYQILFLDRVPDHAAINESVEIIKRLQSERTAGLVNGVLRNVARNIKNIRYPNPTQDEAFYISILTSFPKWAVENWVKQFGEKEAEEVMNALNHKPGIGIRFSRLKYSSKEECKELEEKLLLLEYKIERTLGMTGSYYMHSSGEDIAQNDFFQNGDITVQDPSSALVATLANPAKGFFVVDMCAAPGGKTVVLGEMMGNEGKIVAYDKFEGKLPKIEDNLKRMGITIAEVLQGDATKVKLKKKPDLILVDSPCSGTGTIQKHPEIKWSLEKDSIKKLRLIQLSILENAASNLDIGGVLVYSTCSIEKAENRDIVAEFLDLHEEFELDNAEQHIDAKFTSDGFLEVYPHRHEMMGAFAARLIKTKDHVPKLTKPKVESISTLVDNEEVEKESISNARTTTPENSARAKKKSIRIDKSAKKPVETDSSEATSSDMDQPKEETGDERPQRGVRTKKKKKTITINKGSKDVKDASAVTDEDKEQSTDERQGVSEAKNTTDSTSEE